jgi:hypothetical protein
MQPIHAQRPITPARTGPKSCSLERWLAKAVVAASVADVLDEPS